MFNWTKSYVIEYGPDIPNGERWQDRFTCNHCQFSTGVRPGRVPPRCKGCYEYICDTCANRRDLGDPCEPFEKRLDQHERAIARGMDRMEALKRWGL